MKVRNFSGQTITFHGVEYPTEPPPVIAPHLLFGFSMDTGPGHVPVCVPRCDPAKLTQWFNVGPDDMVVVSEALATRLLLTGVESETLFVLHHGALWQLTRFSR